MKGLEQFSYLSGEEKQTIRELVVGLEPLKDQFPTLNSIDLVIEGGVARNRVMANTMLRLLPQALYTGIDIDTTVFRPEHRQSALLDDETLKRIMRANQYPQLGVSGAIVHGNCFDLELLRGIVQKLGRTRPMFVTIDALVSLFISEDVLLDANKLKDMISPEKPYIAQLHVSLWREQSNYLALVEQEAQNVGWRAQAFERGLLLMKA